MFSQLTAAVSSGLGNYVLSPSHPKLAFEDDLPEWVGGVGGGVEKHAGLVR